MDRVDLGEAPVGLVEEVGVGSYPVFWYPRCCGASGGERGCRGNLLLRCHPAPMAAEAEIPPPNCSRGYAASNTALTECSMPRDATRFPCSALLPTAKECGGTNPDGARSMGAEPANLSTSVDKCA